MNIINNNTILGFTHKFALKLVLMIFSISVEFLINLENIYRRKAILSIVLQVSIAGMPDVGTLYHMYRQGSQLGTMLALTGLRLTSSSIAHAGLATHFCQSSRLPQLRREILEAVGDWGRLREALDRFQSDSLNEDKELVIRETIARLKERCSQAYSSDNVEEIVHNLKMCDNEWSKGQLSLLNKACPLSLK